MDQKQESMDSLQSSIFFINTKVLENADKPHIQSTHKQVTLATNEKVLNNEPDFIQENTAFKLTEVSDDTQAQSLVTESEHVVSEMSEKPDNKLVIEKLDFSQTCKEIGSEEFCTDDSQSKPEDYEVGELKDKQSINGSFVNSLLVNDLEPFPLSEDSGNEKHQVSEIPLKDLENKQISQMITPVKHNIQPLCNIDEAPNMQTTIIDQKSPGGREVRTATDPKSKTSAFVVKSTTDNITDFSQSNESLVTTKSDQLSTSGYKNLDTTDEVPEMTDSLGLLAESSRVMDHDEEEDDGDDDDYYQDDESNQMTAEHSEDSNHQQSETDVPKEQIDTDTDNTVEIGEDMVLYPDKIKKSDFESTKVDGQTEAVDKYIEIEPDNAERIETHAAVAELEKLTAETETDTAIDTQPAVIQAEEDVQSSELETVRISDTSDVEVDDNRDTLATEEHIPKELLGAQNIQGESVETIVDIGSSSEDEDKRQPDIDVEHITPMIVTSVNLPSDMTISSSSGKSSEIHIKPGEVVICGIPKPKTPQKKARLNTSEVTIKTTTCIPESTLVIPETKMEDHQPILGHAKDDPLLMAARFGLEVFNVDSDDDESSKVDEKEKVPTLVQAEIPREIKNCINCSCSSDSNVNFYAADAATLAFFDVSRKKRAVVCQSCAQLVINRQKGLIEGIKNMTPLLELEMKNISNDLVEISDSDSEDEKDIADNDKETIGPIGAQLLEEQLAEMLNATWSKYKLDDRLIEAQDKLNIELDHLEEESKQINSLLDECQLATDKLRNDFYATFERKRMESPALLICDTPSLQYSCREDAPVDNAVPPDETEARPKRKLSSAGEVAAKRTAQEGDTTNVVDAPKAEETPTVQAPVADTKVDDDNTEVSLVTASVESAPAGLPPTGEIVRKPLRVGMTVYAMRNTFGSWLKAKILDCQPKGTNQSTFTTCRVKYEHKLKNPCKTLLARCLAYCEAADVRMSIGTRVIALFKDTSNAAKRESYYSGVIAEIPNPVNNYRYLVFFDDGYAQYVQHAHTRLVCECSPQVWEEVHPFSREFVRQYLLSYPERPMVRLHAGQSLKTEWNGKWWLSRVVEVDASLVKVYFEEDNRSEWIYRGSTRLAPLYLELQAAGRPRTRPMPFSTRNKAQPKMNMPYVEYTRSDEHGTTKPVTPPVQTEEVRRQRAVAKKSTTSAIQAPVQQPQNTDGITSRVVYYTPKNAVKPFKMVPHTCNPNCKRSDVLALKDLRTYNPLAKPLLSGWERQIVRYKGLRHVMYRAPCGRRIRNVFELHKYLQAIHSDMAVDLFDFGPNTHCLAEFVLNKCIVSKKDLSHGKENVPVPCVNYYDESLPEFCSYNTERTPTAGVPLNLDPDFLCGCDCTNDCQDKSKCACWQMTLEGARTIGLDGDNIGYKFRRLPEPLPSGIYECNSRCKCKQTCLNRVAQHPLQLKLQVFKTLNRGWGIRALNDVPKGAFLCVYAGNLLTDATANLDGLNEGDEYLAELDYIEVVEQMKEGYEDDIPEADKEQDQKESSKSEDEDDQQSSDDGSKGEQGDDDFLPTTYGLADYCQQQFNKRLRKRATKEAAKEKEKEKPSTDEDCITISDDEEVREPSRFTAQAGMGSGFVSKYRSVRSHYGKDEACYIMDAKVQGNIGRYLNHSCTPNVFVQNVFVDTHDPRFPWVAFFALCHIRAGTELTWNYNYDVGSVPGKVLYCYCGAPNCRGRLL